MSGVKIRHINVREGVKGVMHMQPLNENTAWKAMYLTLFRGITDALNLLPLGEHTAQRLKQALAEAEELYIRDDE